MTMITKQLLYTASMLAFALILSATRTVQTAYHMGLRCNCCQKGIAARGVRLDLNTTADGVVATSMPEPVATKMPVATPIFRYPVNSSSHHRPLPIPIEVMERYMQQHSVEALRRDPHPERRNYAMAFYQCPLQAGNRLHIFWNGLLWAMLANRTILYKYYDKETCLHYGMQAHASISKAANTARDCGEILDRAPWMASYDEWKHVISNNETEEPFKVPQHATDVTVFHEGPRYPLPIDFDGDYGVDLLSKYPHKILIFPTCYFKLRPLREIELQETLLKSEYGRETVHQLFSLGEDYLYGMFHRYTFQFSDAILESLPRVTDTPFTIGLHSRHRFEALDGCNIDREIACLETILGQRPQDDNGTAVQVRIMSDRPCTISNLTTWLHQRSYSAATVTHKEISRDGNSEHGPFAGAGFFRDLALVSGAKSAIIGMSRSSSDLLRELIVFNQALEEWESAKNKSQKVGDCILPYQSDPAVVPVLGRPNVSSSSWENATHE